ncbi:MAG: GTP-binding protein [Candidatus Kariarchaeaceae archaeon]|jgi:elongation factor 2
MSVKNIRNLSIISHVDHGKTTLSDHLIASGGMLPKHLAGSLRALDFLPEEQRRGITIETTLATFIIKYQEEDYVVNLIDTPGHVDFSGKVAESLRLVDGGLIIVDAVEGIMAQTKTVLRQAIKEKIVLVLFINKIDRLITELELSLSVIQQRIQRIIDEVKSICGEFNYNPLLLPNFAKGTVLIGSAKDGWAIDSQFAQGKGKLSQIVELYKTNKREFPLKTSLSTLLIRCLVNKFPTPLQGQQLKFPDLLLEVPSESTQKDLQLCSDSQSPIALVGRLFRLGSAKFTVSTVRVVSGVLKRGLKLKSSMSSETVRIMRIIELRGRSSRDVSELRSGNIAGIVLSVPIFPGDILVQTNKEGIYLKNISYVQDPVVAVSIEPLKIKEISRLQATIESIVQSTPGLEFESNPDTGELLALGVGTLQLDVLSAELQGFNFDIEVSDPIILQFDMPLKSTKSHCTKYPKMKFRAGKSSSFEKFESHLIFYQDTHSNQLIFSADLSNDAKESFIEVFRQSMRISPVSGVRIKEFTLILETYFDDKKSNTYETGMIMASILLRQALQDTNITLHEPYYTIEINLYESYLGATLQELQKHRAIIEDIVDGKPCLIKAIIPVKNGLKLADVLRQVTDGNVFWSFPSVNFLPSTPEF